MIWKGTKAELLTFIKELNEKHKTIKFDFQISPRKFHFLTQCYIKTKVTTSKQLYIANLQDQQAFLHAKSEHPRSLKSTIPYSQAL